MSQSRDNISREAIRQLRATTANKIAKKLVSVQPMNASAGAIFAPNIPVIKWSAWRKTTSIWPRRSINGRIIFGRINKRSKPEFMHSDRIRTAGRRFRQFATDKELFHEKLKGKE